MTDSVQPTGVLTEPQLGDGDSAETLPWFSTYNRFFGYGSVSTYPLTPFPHRAFCGLSPWEHHVVIAHHGVEQKARQAGFERADDYVLHLIATAPKRGAFCAHCPNQHCAELE